MDEIKATEIGRLLRGRMGLIIGPGVTKFTRSFSELCQELAAKGGVEADETYLLTADRLLAAGSSESGVKTWIREILDKQSKSPVITQLSKLRWAAVLSCALGAHFDDALRLACDKRGVLLLPAFLTGNSC